MDTNSIIDKDFVGRYVRNELSELESDAFELAFFNDSQLAALVEAEQALHAHAVETLADETPAIGRVPQRRPLAAIPIALAATALISAGLYFFQRLAIDAEPIQLVDTSVPDAVERLRLRTERGQNTANSLAIPPSPSSRVEISVPVPPDLEFSDGEVLVTLRYENGPPIWTETLSDVEGNEQSLFLSISASALQVGVYELSIAQVSKGKTVTAVYLFATYVATSGSPTEP